MNSCIKQNKIESVEDNEIVLSLDEMVFYPEHLRDTILEPIYKYVVYVDSYECSPCKIAHLGVWNYYRNELADKDVGFYMILSPAKDKVEEIEKIHQSYKHRIPIYIDTLGVFKRDNPQIVEKATEFHSFLLDKNNKIVVFGDASTNHYVRDEIFRILEENIDSTETGKHP
jgi:hypothetical protein